MAATDNPEELVAAPDVPDMMLCGGLAEIIIIQLIHCYSHT